MAKGNLFVSKEAARRHPGRAASSTNPSPKFTATQVAHASFTPADTKAPELAYSDEDEPRNCQGGDEMDHPERFQFEPSSSKADPSLNNSLANPNQRLSPTDDNQNNRIASPHYFPSLQWKFGVFFVKSYNHAIKCQSFLYLQFW